MRGISRVLRKHAVGLAGLCFCALILAAVSWGAGNAPLFSGAEALPAAVAQTELWESHVPYVHFWGIIDGRATYVTDYHATDDKAVAVSGFQAAGGAVISTGPNSHWDPYTMPPVCDVTQSACQLYPAYGAFDAFVTADRSQWQLSYGFGFCDGLCQKNYSGTVYKYDNRLTTGPLTTVSAGTDLTIEWSCQNQQVVTGQGECIAYDAFNNCTKHATGPSGTNVYFTSTTGNGFSAGPIVSSAHVAPQTTTTYALTCNGSGTGFGSRTMHITIEVTDACPTVADAATSNTDGYKVGNTSGQKVKIPGVGSVASFCLTNSGSQIYFVPAKTETELQAFINMIPNLAGLVRSAQ
jgi:hypothetical protein